MRLTVFPDCDAQPQLEPAKPDYTRPANAPDCVQVVDGCYCAYFEEPRFCWDEPIYCKVRKAGDTTIDMQSSKDGDLCTMVGTTANGRKIWRWTGPAITEEAPAEIVFTNHDLLTFVMPFVNSGYYKYDQMVYNASQTTGIRLIEFATPHSQRENGQLIIDNSVYNIQGQRVDKSHKGLVIYKGRKYVNK